MSERPFSQDHPLVVAHRGASATNPENTLEAFEAAIAAGAGAIEFDVRLTADGAPVVMHDATVDRTTDGRGPVRSLSLAEIAALRIRAGEGVTHVPTLRETLEFVSGRIGIDVEIKNIPGEPDFDGQGQPVVEAVIDTLTAVGFTSPVMVTSFNPWSVAWAREREPQLVTGLLTDPGVEGPVALAFACEQGHPWVLPFSGMVTAAGPSWPAAVHELGMSLGTWVVDDPTAALTLMRSGVDAVATNDPGPLVTARREALGS
jgi:glycerophosphoryl diester phosphodiesterase